jgi:hypothetical protein
MNKALGGARSDDCGSLREMGLSYVAIDTETKTLDPPILPRSAKVGTRGFYHPVLGRLLCPLKYIKDFDADPAYVQVITYFRRLLIFSY